MHEPEWVALSCCPTWRRCDGCPLLASIPIRAVQRCGNNPSPIPASYRDLEYLLFFAFPRLFNINTQAALNGFMQIIDQLLHRLPLSRAAWNRRYFGPVSALIGFMYDHLDFHGFIILPSKQFLVPVVRRLLFGFLPLLLIQRHNVLARRFPHR